MAVPVRNISAPGFADDVQVRTDSKAMSAATVLFFMVGFLTCLNDVVSPHLKSIFALSYTQTQYIPFFFFSSYFVFSYPGGMLVDKLGYKKTMVVGLLIMACGALGFLPAAQFAAFPIFLTALVILAAGMTVVQVAVNPYVTIIGPSATAASRLNLAQAFNSVGTFIAPVVGSYLILRTAPEAISSDRLRSMSEFARQAYRVAQASTVRMPYIIIALGLVLLAIALGLIKLKTTTGVSEHTQDFRPGAFAEALTAPTSIWSQKWALFGAVGIFTYVGAEVSIGNLLVSYMGLPQIAGLKESVAANFLACYWGGAMIGRFIGSAILQKVKTGYVLGFNAICAGILIFISLHTTYTSGATSTIHIFGDVLVPHSLPMWTMLAVGLCNSIMFPSIFTLGIQDLGPLTSKGSSLLIAAIVGGALVPLAQGKLADHIGLHPSFIIPAVCYIYIGIFGIAAIRRRLKSPEELIPVEPV
ncbi:MAG TPA: sugar MFS transporter [Acidobacteriaceae bacterium]